MSSGRGQQSMRLQDVPASDWFIDDGSFSALPQRVKQSVKYSSNTYHQSMADQSSQTCLRSQSSVTDTFINLHETVLQSSFPNYQNCRLRVPSTFDISLFTGSFEWI